MPLLAAIVIGYTPPEPAAGVPFSSPAVDSESPPGSAPASVKAGAGYPLAETWKLPDVPATNVASGLDLKLGASWTVRVKLCVAALKPLLAMMVKEYTPPEPTAGVPDSSQAPDGCWLTVTPAGRVPVTENDDAGKPVAV